LCPSSPSLLEEPSEILQGNSEEVQIQEDTQDTHGKWWFVPRKFMVAKKKKKKSVNTYAE
jgi:hypothetical protein